MTIDPSLQQLQSLYEQWAGCPPLHLEVLPASGSNRRYVRFMTLQGTGVIGTYGSDLAENSTFIYLTRHFEKQRLPVPHILAVSEDGACYLQSDLGSRVLFDALSVGRNNGGNYSDEEIQLLECTLRELPRMQVLGARGLDFNCCYPQAELDTTSVFFDLNYFKYCFLKTTSVDFHELRLQESFEELATALIQPQSYTAFLYRDFQARNVMLSAQGDPLFIDYQGGRRGPVEYDVASFLWQASAHYSPLLREHLIGVYLESLQQLIPVDEQVFRSRLNLFVLFRTLQVLGAYGFRGYYEQKQHFLNSINPAIHNLRTLLLEGNTPIPQYLEQVLTRLVQLPQFAMQEQGGAQQSTGASTPQISSHGSTVPPKSALVVSIYSFSYKKGIPADDSGNGGGYVFDCRSTHNPGRYEPYKHLTGLDAPVIKFLEDDGEILTFLQHVYALADVHVKRYIDRGFTHLMFSFGCTGGQHRSVYSAQHLAQHLHAKYGIQVNLCHREQNIRQVFEAKQ